MAQFLLGPHQRFDGGFELFVVLIVETDRDQAIAWKDLPTRSGRAGFNDLSENTLPGVGPPDAIPGRRFVP